MRASRENRFLRMTDKLNVAFIGYKLICIVGNLNLLAIYELLDDIFARSSIVADSLLCTLHSSKGGVQCL